MAITSKTTKAELLKLFDKHKDIVKDTIKETLSYMGEDTVGYIRKQPQDESWIDRTGNLRSSIAYEIIGDGKVLEVGEGVLIKDGKDGVIKGVEYAKKIGSSMLTSVGNNFAIVVVAGMEYAMSVERRDNKVVLERGKLKADKEFPEYMRGAVRKIILRINALNDANK